MSGQHTVRVVPNVHGGLSQSIENARIGRQHALGVVARFEPVGDVRRAAHGRRAPQLALVPTVR